MHDEDDDGGHLLRLDGELACNDHRTLSLISIGNQDNPVIGGFFVLGLNPNGGFEGSGNSSNEREKKRATLSQKMMIEDFRIRNLVPRRE